MPSKTYIKVTKVIFFIGGLVHLSRLVTGADVNFGGVDVPVWVSGVIGAVALYIAYSGYQLIHKK